MKQTTHFTSHWFQIKEINTGLYMIREPDHVQSYLVLGRNKAALIDTGMGFCDIKKAVESITRLPVTVLNTHWHFDHIGGNRLFLQRGISRIEAALVAKSVANSQLREVYITPCQRQGIRFPQDFYPFLYQITGTQPTFTIDDGQFFDLGDRTLTAIATPGHTRGSISFLDSQTSCLMCGDFAYRGLIFAQFRDSDIKVYMNSLRKVSAIKTIKNLHPSHDNFTVPASFLSDLLAGFEKIKAGSLSPVEIVHWGGRVNRYDFEDFGILTPVQGSDGVELFG
ncbi:MBL fold metallo-hydrolase [candidate division KSB1 bacterium]|nr:MBL fold metallo-hydrolase [candidate division KSB1 bacterium]